MVYSSEVRMYSLGVLAVCVALGPICDILRHSARSYGSVVGVSVAVALCFYTHYLYAVVGVAFYAIWGVVHLRVPAERTRWLASGCLCLMLIAPWLPVALSQLRVKGEQGRALAAARSNAATLAFTPGGPKHAALATRAKELAVAWGSTAGLYAPKALVLKYGLVVPFVMLGAVFVRGLARGDTLCWLALTAALLLTIMALALGLGARRYLLGAVPLFILALGRAVQDATGRATLYSSRAALIALVCVYAAGAWRAAEMRWPQPTVRTAEFLKSRVGKGDRIVYDALYGQVPVDYYLQRMGADLKPQSMGFPVTVYDWWESQPFRGWGSPVISRTDLDRFVRRLTTMERSRVIWLVLYETDYYDPRDDLLEALRTVSERTSIHEFGPLEGERSDLSHFRVAEVHFSD
jgi:hypothetical protein